MYTDDWIKIAKRIHVSPSRITLTPYCMGSGYLCTYRDTMQKL